MSETFAPPSTATYGLSGLVTSWPSARDLLLEQEAAPALAHQLRQRVHRSVRAVHGAERVVDVDVAELGELPREALVVLLFFRVEAEVLEQADLPGAKIVDRPSSPRRRRSPPGRCTSYAGELGETRAARLEAESRRSCPAWAAEVRREDDLRARVRARA